MKKEESDIIIPNKNEQEFIQMAKKLGYKTIYAAYPYEKTPQKTNSDIIPLAFIDEKTPQFPKKCRNSKLPLLIRVRSDPRTIIEQYRTAFIVGMESIFSKDRLHQRSSGLNHIICRAALKSNTTLVFDMSTVFNSSYQDPKRLPLLLGRIRQNKKLCEKYKVNYMLATFSQGPYQMKSPHDIISLLKVI